LQTTGLAGGNVEGGLEVRVQSTEQAITKAPEEEKNSDCAKTVKLVRTLDCNDAHEHANALGSRDCRSVKWTPNVMAPSLTVIFFL
jgi:hypothetical protein